MKSMIGNGECNVECLHASTLFDAGDCCTKKAFECNYFTVGDGTCNEECDRVECGFDGGNRALNSPFRFEMLTIARRLYRKGLCSPR